jgi:tetratricopeptide (TPR) repeat protein
MLVPVIGIIPISSDAAHADRYTYLPGIGLTLAATWAAGDWSATWKHQRVIMGGLMIAIVGALAASGCWQTSFWRNDQMLWTHTLACDSRNSVAHNNLGYAFDAKGQLEEAIPQFRQALEINPDYATAHNNLGVDLVQQGKFGEAMAHFKLALATAPGYADAHCNLGNILLQQGDLDNAIAQYRSALQFAPDHPQALNNLARALAMKGDARPGLR